MQTLYINGAARIGAAFEAAKASSPGEIVEPDYTQYIPKRQLRRLDRASKFALHTTYAALEKAGRDAVDGVVLGVGQTISKTVDGMLRKLISHREEQTNPTNFMNSLLSTAAGQIALQLSCDGYTNTHTQRGFTVEAALLDASLQLCGNTGGSFLVGGVGEVHSSYTGLAGNYGHIGATLTSGVERPIGEGAAIFVVSGQPTAATKACLREIYTVYLTDETARESSARELQELLFADIVPEVDLVVSGRPAGSEAQGIYDRIMAPYEGSTPVVEYKQNIGEFPSAAAHGMYLGVNAIVNSPANNSISRVLVINNYGERYLSALLLTRPE